MTVAVSNIRDMISDGQEDLVKAYIETFSCEVKKDDGSRTSLNPDIEHFLKANAIQFAKMKTAVTYLVFDVTYTISAFLLAQFSKNYAVDEGKRISGTDLMNIAMEQLAEAQNLIGGSIVYLDCEADAKLIRFYEGEHFALFGERISESDGKRYLQYLNFV